MTGPVIGEAAIKVGADTSEFSSQMSKDASSSGSSFGSKIMSGIGGVLKVGAVTAGAGVAGILGTAMVKGFSRLNSIDQAQHKLLGLGHSASQVKSIMNTALDSVQGTAYGMGDAASQAAVLVASGIKPGKDLEKTLKLVGDTASIAGAQFGDIGPIFAKVAANGKATGDTIGMLQDRGIPALKFLSDTMHESMSQVGKDVSAGKVSFKTFQDAMEKGLGGAAQSSGNTFQGALANVGAALSRFGAAVLGPIFSKLPKLFNNAIGWVDQLTAVVGPLGTKIGTVFSQAVKWVMRFVQSPAVKKTAVEWFNRVKRVAQQLWGQIQNLIPKLIGFGKAVVNALLPIVKAVLPVIAAAVAAFAQKVMPVLSAFFGFLSDHKGVVKGIVYAIVGYLALMAAAWVKQAIQATIAAAKNVAAWFTTAAAGQASEEKQTLSLAQIAFKWAWAAAQATYNAIRMAAAWYIGLGPVAWAIGALVLLGAAFVILWKKSETFRNIVTGVWDAVKKGAQAVFDWVKSNWPLLVGILLGPFGLLVALIATHWDTVKKLTSDAWNAVKKAISDAWGAIKNAVQTAIGWVRGVISGFWGWLRSSSSNAWNAVKTVVNTVLGWISTFIHAEISGWISIFHGISSLVGYVTGIFNSIKNAVSNAIGQVVSTVAGLPGKITGALSGMGSLLWNEGTQIVQGLINGIESMGSTLWNSVTSFVTDHIPGPIASALKMLSPSKVTEAQGKMIVQGLINGIESGRSGVVSAMNKMMGDLRQAGETGAENIVRTMEPAMLRIGDAIDRMTTKLGQARTVLANQLQAYNDMFASVSDSITQSPVFGSGGDGAVDFSSMVSGMQAGVAQAKKFNTAMASLKSMGLDKTIYQQLAAQGPGAADQAAAIVAAGTAGVKQLNALQSQLNTQGQQAGKTTADYLYKGSVNAAQAFVNTIAKNKNALVHQMQVAGNALVKAVTQAINRTVGGLTTRDIHHVKGGVAGRAVMPKGGWLAPGTLQHLKHYAGGTRSAPGGWSLLGEHGPELVALPRGSSVLDAGRTKALLAHRDSPTALTTVTVAMSVRMDDLKQLHTLEDFLKMIDQARVTSRKTMRSGAVTA